MRQLTIKEKQETLLDVLREKEETGEAIFGIEKEVALPLVKSGMLHKDTWKYAGGCILDRKKQITAHYEMTDSITGSKHQYYVIRKRAGFTSEHIYEKFLNDLKNFPAYQEKLFYVSSPIIILNNKGHQIDEIKVNL